MSNPSEILGRIYRSAVNSVLPNQLIRSSICIKSSGILEIWEKHCNKHYSIKIGQKNVFLFGAGKAVTGMCQEFLEQIDLHNNQNVSKSINIFAGHLNIPFGTKIEKKQLFIDHNVGLFESGKNNIPDEHSVKNTLKMLDLMQKFATVNQNPIFIGFISGGGSALLSLPSSTVSIEDKRNLIKLLVEKGANITELNTVRSCLSQVKHGKLAQKLLKWNPNCQLITFIISDIIGDPIHMIASGPTILHSDNNQSTVMKPVDILNKYSIDLDEKLKKFMMQEFTPNVSKSQIDPNKFLNIIIGNNSIALSSAKKTAEQNGFKVIMVGSNLSGEARLVIKKLLKIICNYQLNNEDQYQYKGIVWLAGGETTIKMDTSQSIGIGGRCQEMGLLFLDELHRNQYAMDKQLFALFAGTDGQDGPTPLAGVCLKWPPTQFIIDHNSLWKQLHCAIENHDSYNFWKQYACNDCLIETGITGTNVMDVYCLMIVF